MGTGTFEKCDYVGYKVLIPHAPGKYFPTLAAAKKFARRYSWAQIIDQYGIVRFTMDGNKLKSVPY